MNNLYEVLGVEKDVSSDDLKKAYRQKARETHPDQGGDEEKFKEVAYAFRVLNDPGSRLLYDTTGKPERPKMEHEIQNIISQAFNDALNSGATQLLEHARKWVVACRKTFRTERSGLLEKMAMLKRKRKAIKTKGQALNVFHCMVDNTLKVMDIQLKDLEYKIDVADKTMVALEDYTSTEKPPQTEFHITYEGFDGRLSSILEDMQRSGVNPAPSRVGKKPAE